MGSRHEPLDADAISSGSVARGEPEHHSVERYYGWNARAVIARADAAVECGEIIDEAKVRPPARCRGWHSPDG